MSPANANVTGSSPVIGGPVGVGVGDGRADALGGGLGMGLGGGVTDGLGTTVTEGEGDVG
jgi:hypothetical protein